jgi:hypothetical protein
MAILTEQEYFQEEFDNVNEQYLGDYQWFTFNEFIQELEMIAADNDSYLNNTRRSQFVRVAKQGVKLFQREIKKDTTIIQFKVLDDLTFPYPQDYVNWVSLSVIYDNTLVPIFINKGINTALTMMQEGNTFVYDQEGNVVRTPTEDLTNEDKYLKVEAKYANQMSTQGQAVFNDNQGRISFGSDMQGMSVVLEYYSDGLFAWTLSDCEIEERKLKPIRIHKDLKEALIKYVYQEIVGYRRNVPANEKQRARLEYRTYLHQAKLDRLDFNLYTVSRLLSSSVRSPNNVSPNTVIPTEPITPIIPPPPPPIVLRTFNNKFRLQFGSNPPITSNKIFNNKFSDIFGG